MMGDEADADWQDGLVEWGIEDAKEYYRNRMGKDTSPAARKDRCSPSAKAKRKNVIAGCTLTPADGGGP